MIKISSQQMRLISSLFLRLAPSNLYAQEKDANINVFAHSKIALLANWQILKHLKKSTAFNYECHGLDIVAPRNFCAHFKIAF